MNIKKILERRRSRKRKRREENEIWEVNVKRDKREGRGKEEGR